MESSTFDRLARLLGGAASRRAGIGVAAATLLGRGVAEAARPKPSGPCKSEKRKDNTCEKDSECCTGICETAAGKTNKDGKGRCRCRRAGQECTEDKNCCTRGRKSKLACVGGICGKPCTELGQACDVATSICCIGICVGPPTSDPALDGSTCCLPIGESGCTQDTHCCGGPQMATCNAGVCANVCLPLRAVCDPAVTNCCAGTCSPYAASPGFEPRANYACCISVGQSTCSADADCCDPAAVCVGQSCQYP